MREMVWNRRVVRRKPHWTLVLRQQALAATTLAKGLWAQPGDASQSRFIVHSLGRSGSTMLVDLMRGHPAVHCDGELLSHTLYVTTAERLIRTRARLYAGVAYGFKVRPRHYETQGVRDPHALLARLVDDGWRVVHLERLNLLRLALSSLRLRETGVVHRTVQDRQEARRRLLVDIPQLRRRLEGAEEETAIERQALAGIPHLHLRYEEDLLPGGDVRDGAMARVFGYLGLPAAPVRTHYVRLSSDQLSDMVENLDELAAALQGTPYERCLTAP